VNRDQKAAVVERIAGQLQEAEAVIALDYRGLSVKQAVDLRTSLTEAGATFQVAKNTLTERAADQAGADSLKSLLEGPTALTFVKGDVALAAKALATFRRQNNVLEFKGGQMGGEALSADQIESIAKLPARDVLYAQFAGVVASPLTGLVRGLGSLIGGLALQLGQIAEKGLVGGESAEGGGQGAEAEPAAEPAEAEAAEEAPAAEADDSAPAADEAPAAEDTTEEPAASEAPGDPVAEAEAAESDETSNETETEEG
jgi:large subunit ribosomal protein L10